jgi:hypothetical protein
VLESWQAKHGVIAAGVAVVIRLNRSGKSGLATVKAGNNDSKLKTAIVSDKIAFSFNVMF